MANHGILGGILLSVEKKFVFEIINKLGVISERQKGWKKQLTRISWNGAEPKYDIRNWSDDYKKMGKGITFTEEELRALKRVIDEEIAFLDKQYGLLKNI